jgi:transcriptional regulator with XRE-family HTH domain
MQERRKKKLMNLVGPQIRRLRYQQGLTQPAFAAKCQLTGWDISREGIAKIESQVRGVSDIELMKLAKALRVHFSVLFP